MPLKIAETDSPGQRCAGHRWRQIDAEDRALGFGHIFRRKFRQFDVEGAYQLQHRRFDVLLEEMLARHPEGGWFWDLLPANEASVRIASAFGFEPVRRLARMVWGQELRGQDDQIFAIGGLEFG